MYLRVLHLAHLLRRPMTLGVRACVFDGGGRLFLVRHTYVKGWYLPGGGVEAGEPAHTALERELAEEGRLAWDTPPRLVSVHLNRAGSRRDHVLFYRVDGARQEAPRPPDREIAECGFFALSDLPQDTTQATHRRIDEAMGKSHADPLW